MRLGEAYGSVALLLGDRHRILYAPHGRTRVYLISVSEAIQVLPTSQVRRGVIPAAVRLVPCASRHAQNISLEHRQGVRPETMHVLAKTKMIQQEASSLTMVRKMSRSTEFRVRNFAIVRWVSNDGVISGGGGSRVRKVDEGGMKVSETLGGGSGLLLCLLLLAHHLHVNKTL